MADKLPPPKTVYGLTAEAWPEVVREAANYLQWLRAQKVPPESRLEALQLRYEASSKPMRLAITELLMMNFCSIELTTKTVQPTEQTHVQS